MEQLPVQTSEKAPVKVAYFSMEIMLENDIYTYAGGLGMLAGDILRSLADKEIPSVGVTIAFDNGYTNQSITNEGTQNFVDARWEKNDLLVQLPNTIKIKVDGKELTLSCYQYNIVGRTGFEVPVYLLSADYFENDDEQKSLTQYLYDKDFKKRLIQEVILGIGGVKMLRDLGFSKVENFHMNDGHCAFLTLEVLRERNYDMESTKSVCCFTTHTPVPAGIDIFGYDIAYPVMGEYLPLNIKELAGDENLNMAKLAMSMSKYVNAVSKKHRDVSNDMFKRSDIDFITNGIHPLTWSAPVTKEIFDLHIPEWRNDLDDLKKVDEIPDKMLLEMHRINKRTLIHHVNLYLDQKVDTGSRFDYEKLTITFARRCVAYKRPDLIFDDIERLLRIGLGKIQLIFAGKTHPSDEEAAKILKKILDYRKRYSAVLSIAYIENYSPSLAKLLVSGSDVWLNNPVIPLEASGTSGMKAALNGTINMSIMDGWVIEGVEIEPEAFFKIGDEPSKLFPERDDEIDAHNLYDVLENQVIPTFFNDPDKWLRKMKASVRLGAYFNTDRVVDEYISKAWK